MNAQLALSQLLDDLSNSYPWKPFGSYKELAANLATELPGTEWPTVLDSIDKLPSALELGDSEDFEEQLGYWNCGVAALVRGFARSQPEACLSILASHFDPSNVDLILQAVALGLQDKQHKGLASTEAFGEGAAQEMDAKNCKQQRCLLAILHRGDEKAKTAFRERYAALPEECDNLRGEFFKFL